MIADDLDIAGHTFLAVEKGEAIGTVRLNLCSEGAVGILEELYGMRASKHHPGGTAVCTKFIVKKAQAWRPHIAQADFRGRALWDAQFG